MCVILHRLLLLGTRHQRSKHVILIVLSNAWFNAIDNFCDVAESIFNFLTSCWARLIVHFRRTDLSSFAQFTCSIIHKGQVTSSRKQWTASCPLFALKKNRMATRVLDALVMTCTSLIGLAAMRRESPCVCAFMHSSRLDSCSPICMCHCNCTGS